MSGMQQQRRAPASSPNLPASDAKVIFFIIIMIIKSSHLHRHRHLKHHHLHHHAHRHTTLLAPIFPPNSKQALCLMTLTPSCCCWCNTGATASQTHFPPSAPTSSHLPYHRHLHQHYLHHHQPPCTTVTSPSQPPCPLQTPGGCFASFPSPSPGCCWCNTGAPASPSVPQSCSINIFILLFWITLQARQEG